MGIRFTVLGTGYLGATHTAGMAELGHDVLGVDVRWRAAGWSYRALGRP
jgi:UDP-glucose 6-dehydrogenase